VRTTVQFWHHHKSGRVVHLERIGEKSEVHGYAYLLHGSGSSSNFYCNSDDEAITISQKKIDLGYFSDDRWKTPYTPCQR
jgi:hypothetical protein